MNTLKLKKKNAHVQEKNMIVLLMKPFSEGSGILAFRKSATLGGCKNNKIHDSNLTFQELQYEWTIEV